jgi:ubiquinol-cytochrome c reductase cytochrome c subunit
MKHIIVALAGLILAAGPTCAQQDSAPAGQGSAPAGNAENGKTLYAQIGCYQCHGLAGQGARMTGPRISRTEFPFEGFLYQLRHPANQMPPYEAAVVSNQDAADLYAYVRQMPAPRDPNSIPLLKVAR